MTKDLPPAEDWLGDYATETLGAVVDQAVAMLANEQRRGHLGVVTLAAIRATGLDELHRRAAAMYAPLAHRYDPLRSMYAATATGSLSRFISPTPGYRPSGYLRAVLLDELHTRALAEYHRDVIDAIGNMTVSDLSMVVFGLTGWKRVAVLDRLHSLALAGRPGGNDVLDAQHYAITEEAIAYHTLPQART